MLARARFLHTLTHARSRSPSQAAAFRDAWRLHSASVLTALRAADWGTADGLRSVAWRVVVPMAGDGVAPDAPPEQRAVFELGLGPPAGSAAATGGADADDGASVAPRRVVFEMTHAELGGLFDDLERIQGQLDALS